MTCAANVLLSIVLIGLMSEPVAAVEVSAFCKAQVPGKYIIEAQEGNWNWGIPEVGYQTNGIYFGATLARSERPHILWKDGEPECLFLACHDEDPTAGYFLRIVNWEGEVDLEAREVDIQRRPSQTRTGRPKQSKYLETGGERKLEVVYKHVAGQNLRLDLYYPDMERPLSNVFFLFLFHYFF